MADEAARKQLGEALGEGARQLLDEGRLAHIDIEHREIAVELQACRFQRAAIPLQHFGFIDAPLRPALLDRPLTVVEQRLKTIGQHGQAEGGALLHPSLTLLAESAVAAAT